MLLRTDDQTILNKCQNLKLFPHLAPVAVTEGPLRPFEQLGVPGGTVIQRQGRYSAHHIVRTVTVA
jgi:hypothetical protein